MPEPRNLLPLPERRNTLLVLLALAGTALVTTISLRQAGDSEPREPAGEGNLDDRYVKVLLAPSGPADDPPDGTHAEAARSMDAGEGARHLSGAVPERARTEEAMLQMQGATGTGVGVVGSAHGLGGLGTRGHGYGGGAWTAGSVGSGAQPTLDPGFRSRPRPAHAGDAPVAGPLFQRSPATEGTEPVALAGLTDPAVDPWSTFAADVDTASWSYTRRSMSEGRLPEPDRVRVEEFINAFHYDYAQPVADVPFAVDMEAAPDPLRAGHTVLRVGIQGAVPDTPRPPARLTFLVDVSGSMRGPDRLGLAQDSLLWLVDRLGPQDSVALVTYAGATQIVLEPTPAWQRQTIRNAIRNLHSGGGTSMGAGMTLAYELADAAYVDGAENRVIVLSDGDANIGGTSADAILEQVRKHAEGGITMSTLGFGMGNYRDDMMETLADRGDGTYAYIDSITEARHLFGSKLGATLQTIARDVKIQVAFDPDAVRGWRLLGYENRAIADEDFRNDAVDAGEIGAGHQVTALYDVVLRDSLPTAQPIARVRLRAKPPGPDRPAEEWTTRFLAGLVQPGWQQSSPDLRAAWTLAQTAENLRDTSGAESVPWKRLSAEAQVLEAQGFDGADDLRARIADASMLDGGMAQR